MYKFPEETLKSLRENRLETLDLGALGFKGKTTLSGHKGAVNSLAVLPDGRLALGSDDNTIRIWNVRRGACEATLSGHTHSVSSLAMLPDGRLASGSVREIRLWNESSEVCEATLSGHKGGVHSLAMLSDGRLASGSWREIRLWNVSSGVCEATLSGHGGSVSSLALLPDGRLASGSVDKTIRLWNVRSGVCEATLSGHTNDVSSLALLPDGRLASGSGDKTIRLWNLRSGKCEAILSHENAVLSLTVLSDGGLAAVEYLKSGAGETKIRIWPIAPDKDLFLSLKSALEKNNTLKKIKWSGCESLFNDEEHAWLNALLEGNLASKIAVLSLPQALKAIAVPKITKPAAGEAGTVADDSANELAKRKAEMAAPEARLAAMQLELQRNLAGKLAVSSSSSASTVIASPKVIGTAAGGAGAIASDSESELAKLKAEMAAQKALMAAKELEEKAKQAELEEKNRRLEAELAAAKLKAEAEKIKEPAASSFSIISSKDLKLEKELGKGGFGIVYEAKWGDKAVAVKSLLMADLPERLALEFKSEALLQAALHHENIVELKGVCLEPKKYALVMELMPKGSLFALLHSSQELPWSLRLSITRDIANGLSYLHQQGIVHRDLKSLNVLLNDRLRAKLSDFGLSDIKAGTVATVSSKIATDGTSTPGTILWMAPELFKRGAKCTEASDIYALGMVFWEIASRAVPFKDARDASIAKDWIKDGEREEIPAETPAKIASLIGRCWAQKVEDRPKSTKVVLDELMTETLGGGSSAAGSGYMMFSR